MKAEPLNIRDKRFLINRLIEQAPVSTLVREFFKNAEVEHKDLVSLVDDVELLLVAKVESVQPRVPVHGESRLTRGMHPPYQRLHN